LDTRSRSAAHLVKECPVEMNERYFFSELKGRNVTL
jgi:hypothetical protein